MRKTFLSLVSVFLLAAPLAYSRGRLQGYAERGGQLVTVNAIPSALRYQQSCPNDTITVYVSGTLTLATLYSDSSGTAKSNPFSADSGAFWFFYADDGDYDVRLTSCSRTFTALRVISGATSTSACSFSGANAGAQITNAIASLPATGGIVDARCHTGAQVITSTVNITKPVQVLLGAATYTATVPANAQTFILAAGSSLIGVSPLSTVIATTTDGDAVGPFSDTTIANLTLRGRNVLPSGGGTASGINTGGVARLRIQNNIIENWGHYGINTGGASSDITIQSNTVRGSKLGCILIPGLGSVGIQVIDNFVENCLSNGIDTNADRTIISRNRVLNCGTGVIGSDVNGIFVGSASYCVITDNTVDASYGTGIRLGAVLGTVANFNTVANNTVTGGTSVAADGISLDGSSPGTLKGNTIANNTCTGNARTGIEIDGGVATVQQNVIANNICSGNGSHGLELGGANALDNRAAFNMLVGNTGTALSTPSGTGNAYFGNVTATGVASFELRSGSTNIIFYPVIGTPEGAVTANPGSIAFNISGGAGTTFYVKESGVGNVGWVGK